MATTDMNSRNEIIRNENQSMLWALLTIVALALVAYFAYVMYYANDYVSTTTVPVVSETAPSYAPQ